MLLLGQMQQRLIPNASLCTTVRFFLAQSGALESMPESHYFCFKRLQPENVDERRKRRRLLSSARIVEEESGEGLAPILQHADEFTAFEFRRDPLI